MLERPNKWGMGIKKSLSLEHRLRKRILQFLTKTYTRIRAMTVPMERFELEIKV